MKSRKTWFASIGLVAVLALTACTAPADEPADEPSPLTLVAATPPISLDPARSNNGLGEIFIDIAYDSLLHATSVGSYEPALAESWSYVGDGNLQFQLTLRDGLTFADGTPLDADAVVAYLNYFRDAQGPFAATMGIVDRFEAPDARTVMVYLTAPSPDLEFQFSEGGLWGAIVSPAGLADPEALGTTTAGAGAYVLDESASVSGSSYVYTPNENYYAPERQKWPSITINVIADSNAALQSLLSGQSNWMQGSPDLVSAAEAGGLTVAEAVPQALLFFLQDRDGTLVPALGDVRARQAINFAIDRDAVASVLGGSPLQQIIAEDRVGFNPDAESVYTYDPDKARALLAEAGYPNGFTMSVISPGFDPLASRAVEIIASQLSEVGITLEITTAATFPDYARQQEAGTFSSTVLMWGSSTMFSVAQQLVLPTGVVNPLRTSNDEMLALFNEGAGTVPADAVGIWQDFSLLVTEEAWFAPLLQLKTPFFGTPGIDPAGDGFASPNPLFF